MDSKKRTTSIATPRPRQWRRTGGWENRSQAGWSPASASRLRSRPEVVEKKNHQIARTSAPDQHGPLVDRVTRRVRGGHKAGKARETFRTDVKLPPLSPPLPPPTTSHIMRHSNIEMAGPSNSPVASESATRCYPNRSTPDFPKTCRRTPCAAATPSGPECEDQKQERERMEPGGGGRHG